MVVRWASSESSHYNVEIAEWFPDEMDRQRLLTLLNAGMPKLGNKQEKVCAWLRTQSLG
ncbi:hypothetical protein ABIA53_000858 [Pseudomonas monsensis]